MNYKDKFKLIRPYVTFNIDLRRSEKSLTTLEKRQISRYYNALFGIDSPSRAVGYKVKTYRPRKDKNKQIVKKAYGYDGLKLKALPIPVSDPNAKFKLKKRKGKTLFKISEFNVTRTILLYDMNNFLSNPQGEIDRITAPYDNKTQFSVLCGNFEYYETFSNKTFIGELVEIMQNKYANHAEWMRGLGAYSFENQMDFVEYQRTMMKKRKDDKKNRQKTKRRKRYEEEKKGNRRR